VLPRAGAGREGSRTISRVVPEANLNFAFQPWPRSTNVVRTGLSYPAANRVRAMMSRMMSLVPSQISSSFASRSHFCTSDVRM
jgi:hypothetical protein